MQTFEILAFSWYHGPMMILEHSIREDSHRAMRRSHAAVMHPNATPESAKASLKQHRISQSDLRKNPLFVEMWIDRFPDDASWLAFLANAVAFITETTSPWNWRHVTEKTIAYMSPSRQAVWESDPQTAVWRFYDRSEDTSASPLAALSFADLSAEVWRADVPVSTLYEVADRILCSSEDAPAVAKPALAFALYTHGLRCFYRDVPIEQLRRASSDYSARRLVAS